MTLEKEKFRGLHVIFNYSANLIQSKSVSKTEL